MSIAITLLIAWSVVIILWIIPKRLSEIEMLFIYLADCSVIIIFFAYINLNYKNIVIGEGGDTLATIQIYRLVAEPLILLISSNLFLYSNKVIRWASVLCITLLLVLLQQAWAWMGLVTFRHWNILFSVFTAIGFVLFSQFAAWLKVHVGHKEGPLHDRL